MNGTNGPAGTNAYTTFTASFTMPAEGASAVATVGTTAPFGVNQVLYAAKVDGSVRGYLQVTAIGGATSITLKNLENTASGLYTDNSAPGANFIAGSQLQAGGVQGPAGLMGSTAIAGDVTGTLAASLLTLNSAKGALAVGNGTKAVAVPAGTDGHMIAYDVSDAEGLKSLAALPLTGGTNVAKSRLARLSATTGLPIPLASSKAQVNDPGSVGAGEMGAIVLDASAGNARGTDAVDLQVNRNAVTQVASGARSFIGAGDRNMASGPESAVTSGDSNVASGDRSVVGGGQTNTASAEESFVGGGQDNTANGMQSAVVGGDTNTASGEESFVGGGKGNSAGGTQSVVAGGDGYSAGGTERAVGGGNGNSAGGLAAVVAGGGSNNASAESSAIPGGFLALADKYGQVAHAAGGFAAAGDAQKSDLIWRIATSDATANVEAFLNGATQRATVGASRSWAFEILVLGRSAAGVTAAWRVTGAIRNNAGATALVAAVTNTLIADGTGGTWGAIGNVPVVDADATNNALRMRVTGAAATLIRWVATARIIEAGY